MAAAVIRTGGCPQAVAPSATDIEPLLPPAEIPFCGVRFTHRLLSPSAAERETAGPIAQ
jgi:hypothetical protein